MKPRRPKSWSAADVETHLVWARDTLDELAGDVGAVFYRATCDIDNGYRSPAGGEGRGSKYGGDGANNGSTPSRVLNGKGKQDFGPPDPVARAIQAYLEGVVSLCAVLGDMVKHKGTICGLTPEAARELVEQAKPQRSAECANCGRVVENTPNDPIRSGRCGACWQWRRRHDGAERPKDQWENVS